MGYHVSSWNVLTTTKKIKAVVRGYPLMFWRLQRSTRYLHLSTQKVTCPCMAPISYFQMARATSPLISLVVSVCDSLLMSSLMFARVWPIMYVNFQNLQNGASPAKWRAKWNNDQTLSWMKDAWSLRCSNRCNQTPRWCPVGMKTIFSESRLVNDNSNFDQSMGLLAYDIFTRLLTVWLIAPRSIHSPQRGQTGRGWVRCLQGQHFQSPVDLKFYPISLIENKHGFYFILFNEIITLSTITITKTISYPLVT